MNAFSSNNPLESTIEAKYAAAEECMQLFIEPGMKIGLLNSSSNPSIAQLLLDAISRKTNAGLLTELYFYTCNPSLNTYLNSLDFPLIHSTSPSYNNTLNISVLEPIQIDSSLNCSLHPSYMLDQVHTLQCTITNVAVIHESQLRPPISGISLFYVLIASQSSLQSDFIVSSIHSCLHSLVSVPSFGFMSISVLDSNDTSVVSADGMEYVKVELSGGAVIPTQLVHLVREKLKELVGVIQVGLLCSEDKGGVHELVVGCDDGVVYTQQHRRWRYSERNVMHELVNEKFGSLDDVESDSTLKEKKESVSGWQFVSLNEFGDDHELKRLFKFKNGCDSARFIERCLKLGQDMNASVGLTVEMKERDLDAVRNPFGNGRSTEGGSVTVGVTLKTHKYNGVTDRDIALAQEIALLTL